MAFCEQCGKEHDGTFGSGRFCNRGCSNKWVALHQSDEAKSRKIEKGKKNLIPHPENLLGQGIWTDEDSKEHSIRMKKIMESPEVRKSISDKLKGRVFSESTRTKISEGVKVSHVEGRNKGWVTGKKQESYAEHFWKTVLNNNSIPYEQEKKILHSELGLDTKSYYFLDFYLPEKNVDLEIDGHQHYEESRKLHDQKRDANLESAGYIVYRIKYANSKNSLRVQEDIDRFLEWYKNL